MARSTRAPRPAQSASQRVSSAGPAALVPLGSASTTIDRRRRAERLARPASGPARGSARFGHAPQLGGAADAGASGRSEGAGSRAWRHRLRRAAGARKSDRARQRCAISHTRSGAGRIIGMPMERRRRQRPGLPAGAGRDRAPPPARLRRGRRGAQLLPRGRPPAHLAVGAQPPDQLAREADRLRPAAPLDPPGRAHARRRGAARAHPQPARGRRRGRLDDPIGGRRARLPPRPVLGAGVRHRRARDLARRPPCRDRGPVRPVPAARGDRGRAGQRGRRRLVSDRPRPRHGRPPSSTCTAAATPSAPPTATGA